MRRIRKVNGVEIGKVGGTLRRLRVFNRDFGDAGSAVRAAHPEQGMVSSDPIRGPNRGTSKRRFQSRRRSAKGYRHRPAWVSSNA